MEYYFQTSSGAIVGPRHIWHAPGLQTQSGRGRLQYHTYSLFLSLALSLTLSRSLSLSLKKQIVELRYLERC